MLIGLICTPGVKIKVNPHMYVYVQTLSYRLRACLCECGLAHTGMWREGRQKPTWVLL